MDNLPSFRDDDFPARSINLDTVAILEVRSVALEHRQTVIHGIAIKQPREGLGQHGPDTQTAHDLDCLLPSRRSTEIGPTHQNIAFLNALRIIGVDVLQDMLGQEFHSLAFILVLVGKMHIGIEEIAEEVGPSLNLHCFNSGVHEKNSLGSVIFPVRADAATVAGEAM